MDATTPARHDAAPVSAPSPCGIRSSRSSSWRSWESPDAFPPIPTTAGAMIDDHNPYAPPQANVDGGGSNAEYWREGRKVLYIALGSDLPARCVRCNAPAVTPINSRKLYWHHWGSPADPPQVRALPDRRLDRQKEVRRFPGAMPPAQLCAHHETPRGVVVARAIADRLLVRGARARGWRSLLRCSLCWVRSSWRW